MSPASTTSKQTAEDCYCESISNKIKGSQHLKSTLITFLCPLFLHIFTITFLGGDICSISLEKNAEVVTTSATFQEVTVLV